jgi:hypothetical protein
MDMLAILNGTQYVALRIDLSDFCENYKPDVDERIVPI